MVAAMMLPSAVPLLRLFTEVSAAQAGRGGVLACFAGGYLAAYLLRHYRRGPGAAFRLGWGHGLWCLGCCWALMLVMFAVGVADLGWMAALTALMAYEKIGRHGPAVATATGILALAVAPLVAAQPTWIPW